MSIKTKRAPKMKFRSVRPALLVWAQIKWKVKIQRGQSGWSARDTEEFKSFIGFPTDLDINKVDVGTFKKLEMLAAEEPTTHWPTLFKIIDIKYPLTEKKIQALREIDPVVKLSDALKP